MHALRWGLVPPWARELKGFAPINCRAETVAAKAPFAELYARPERRCLILADGWYEWLKSEDKKGDRIPFRYTVDGGAPFAFAGLWGRRRIGGELIASGHDRHHARQRRRRAGARPDAGRPGRARRGGGVAGGRRRSRAARAAGRRPRQRGRRPTRRSTARAWKGRS